MPPKKKTPAGEKRKAEAEAAPPRPKKKLTKEQKAEARERARVAMKDDASALSPKKTPGKKTPSGPVAVPRTTPTTTPASKMTRDDKAAARERARVAMMGGSAAAKATTPVASSNRKKAPKKSSTASKVTIREDDDDDAVATMPLPPTSLQRTQSTPLELEIQQQVIANAASVDKPAFTEAPPAHLLKFAPTELEEGYDHDEANTGNFSATEFGVGTTPSSAIPTPTTVTTSNDVKIPTKIKMVVGFALLFWSLLLYSTEGWFYHRWTYYFVAIIPVWFNPYRTTSGHIIPYQPCFLTNIDDPPVPMRSECRVHDLPFENCPLYGECYGGDLQKCLHSDFVQLSRNRQRCELKPNVKRIHQHVVDTVDEWTMDYTCGGTKEGFFSAFRDETPSPYMMITMRDTTPSTKQPMFALEYILDIDPLLLSGIPRKDRQTPVELLYALVDVANPLPPNETWLKLQVLSRYNGAANGNGDDMTHVQLVARRPSQQTWFRSWFAYPQCTLWQWQSYVAYLLRTPWLVGLWMFSMISFGIFYLIVGVYGKRAKRQQALLQSIEDVREFTLEILEASEPQKWRVDSELKEYILHTVPMFEGDEALYRNRIWPRVKFDIRGDPRVAKSVIVANGELVDIWTWVEQPKQQQAATAEEEESES